LLVFLKYTVISVSADTDILHITSTDSTIDNATITASPRLAKPKVRFIVFFILRTPFLYPNDTSPKNPDDAVVYSKNQVLIKK
jgi:hypothetical protein